MSKPWSYCPECGSEETQYEEGDHKQCANCHQEWFSDIDYSDVVRKHLSGQHSDKDAVIERLRAELAALKAGQGEAVYQLPSHARGDKWYGFGYVDFSSREDLSRLADYLKDLLDDVPETPLYTAPPASADAVSVPVELLKRTIMNLLYGSARDNAEELRALLAQSESKVKP